MAYTTYRHSFMEGDSRGRHRPRRFRARARRLTFRAQTPSRSSSPHFCRCLRRTRRAPRHFAHYAPPRLHWCPGDPTHRRAHRPHLHSSNPVDAAQHAVAYHSPFEEPVNHHDFQQAPEVAMGQLEDQYADIERRIQQLEDIVTSNEFDLKRKVR